MKVVNRRCAGLDVHKDEVVACVRLAGRGEPNREVRRFATTTRGLLELAEWLEASEVTQGAMEATGVYWKPVWHVLEERFQLVLANAAHVRNVPGRKSDVNDATWIADLLAHDLIRASFVPPAPIQELRDLTRTRKQLSREIVQHTQRIQKVLEDANIKLSSLVSDMLGASGRRILKALIDGESDAAALAALGGSRLKCSRQDLKDGLEGRITAHHRFLIGQHLRMIEELEAALVAFDARIEAALEPFRDAAERLTSLPGISDVAAQVIIAEIGADMSPFPSGGHLLSWAGLTPRLDESAGKRRSTRVKKGAPWLKPVLVQCAFAAARAKNSYFQAQFLRLKARRGPKKAAIAVAAAASQPDRCTRRRDCRHRQGGRRQPRPLRAAVELLTSIFGVSTLSAQVIVAEIGIDMSRFPTAGHLLSWAGMVPRNDESAGKRRSTRLRQGAPWLKTILVQCAWAASRKKQSYFQAQFHRLRARRGAKKAICAVAASILTAAYHMIKTGTFFQDLGPDHFQRRDKHSHTQRLLRRLQELGYAVEITPLPQAT